ncbi:hypothetical protein [Methylibium rhizosphaerae]|uniref:hypothetical protein n=1 Tax=Methylibium rhizosphaerae TaxID=2570323 RepID=UPI00112BD71D|nr:hypothetical protein [Methylibium rhizosphaerae]
MAAACQAVEPERNTTRLYFDGRSDQLLAARNDAWVLYAFLWHLLLMDYANGEDFTHWLIMAAPLLYASVHPTLTGQQQPGRKGRCRCKVEHTQGASTLFR